MNFENLLINVLKEVFEYGLEVSIGHRVLHIASKFFFYLAIGLVLKHLPLTSLLMRIYPFFLAVLGFLMTIALMIIANHMFIHRYLSSASMSMSSLGSYISHIDKVDKLSLREKLLQIFVKAFYKEMLSVSKGKSLCRLVKFVLPIVIPTVFSNFVVMPLTLLVLLEAIGRRIEDVTLLLNSWATSLALLLLAITFEAINIFTLIPTESGGSSKGDNIFEDALYAIMYLTFLRLGQPLTFATNRRVKLLITVLHLLMSDLWSFLLPSRRHEEMLTLSQFKKVVLVFIPLPKHIAEPNSNDHTVKVVQNICRDVLMELGIEEEKRSHIAESSCIAVKGMSKINLSRLDRERAIEKALTSIESSIRTAFQGWNIELVNFEKLIKIMTSRFQIKASNNEDPIYTLFKKYAVVEGAIMRRGSEAVKRLLALYSDKELIELLKPFSETFLMIIPLVIITTLNPYLTLYKHIPLRGGVYTLQISVDIYVVIPLLIALNPLAKPEKVEEVIEVLEEKD